MTGGRKLSALPSLRRRRASRARPGRLKGRMQNIIVVKEPDRMFSQAVFFLRDDYFLNSDTSPQELLRQAEEAAESYTAGKTEATGPLPLIILIFPVLILIALALIFILNYFA